MSTDTRDLIARLQMQLAGQGQPSFAGIQAPVDPSATQNILQQLQQQAQVADASRPSSNSEWAFLHDAGKADMQRAANSFGNAALQAANVINGGAPVSPASKNASLQGNAILAARKMYSDRLGAGDDPLAAQAAGLKVLSDAGLDVSDQQAKLAEAQLKQQATQAEASKNTAQAANYSAQDVRERAKDAREEKQNTWQTIKETDGAVIQRNGLGEIRVQQKVPAALQAAAATDDLDPSQSLSPSKELIAQRIARGDMAMIPSRAKDALAMNSRALSINPDLTQALFPNRQKALTAITSGKQGDNVRSFNVAYAHLDTVNDAIDALQNGDTRGFNAIANRIAVETGRPAPTNLDTAMQMVKGELAKAIVGSRPAEGEVDKMLAGVTSANSPDQLRGAVNTAKELMLGQAAGIKRQFNSSVTGNSFKFEDALSPSFRRDLEAYEEKASKPISVPVTSSNGVRLQGPNGAPLSRSLPPMNDQGWTLKKDAKGNMAYVSPDGKNFTEVK